MARPAIDVARLDALARDTVARVPLLGLSVAIAWHGELVFQRAYGAAALDRATAIGPETVFPIASLTKQFTAAAVLQLVDAGLVRLDAPLATYVPALALPVTIRQLLWQTAGLREDLAAEHGKDGDAIIAQLATNGTEHAPGTRWKYSNSNYLALTAVIERVSGQRYADYVRDHLARPAKLIATAPCPAVPSVQPSLVAGGALIDGRQLDNRFMSGAGALCATAADLLRWHRALFAGEVVSPASLAVMTTNGTLTDGTPIHYAAGLIADALRGHRRIWHDGGLAAGYAAQLARYPDDDLEIAVLANTYVATSPLATLEQSFARALLFPPVDAALVAAASGRYEINGIELEVRAIAGELHVLVPSDGEDHVIYATAPDELAFDDAPTFHGRLIRDGARVVALELTLGGAAPIRVPRR